LSPAGTDSGFRPDARNWAASGRSSRGRPTRPSRRPGFPPAYLDEDRPAQRSTRTVQRLERSLVRLPKSS